MSDQCAQKMDDIIEGGMNERDHLYQEIEQYEHDTKVQAKRITELETIIKSSKTGGMRLCCVNTAAEVEEDYQKRVKELEEGLREVIELQEGSYDSDPLRFEINRIQEKFKELLK